MTTQSSCGITAKIEGLVLQVDLLERQLGAIYTLTSGDEGWMDVTEARSLAIQLFGSEIHDVEDQVIEAMKEILINRISLTDEVIKVYKKELDH